MKPAWAKRQSVVLVSGRKIGVYRRITNTDRARSWSDSTQTHHPCPSRFDETAPATKRATKLGSEIQQRCVQSPSFGPSLPGPSSSAIALAATYCAQHIVVEKKVPGTTATAPFENGRRSGTDPRRQMVRTTERKWRRPRCIANQERLPRRNVYCAPVVFFANHANGKSYRRLQHGLPQE
jgi:hypothetical protein